MKRIRLFGLSAAGAFALLIVGCSQSALRQGDQALQHANYQQALAYFEQALHERPDDPVVQRALGRVYYHLNDFDQAEKFLKAAESRLPKDATTAVYRGMVAEAKSDFAGAAEMYQKFLATNGKSKMAPQIKGRLLYVQNVKLREQVADAIKEEDKLAKETPAENTVGVLPFTVPGEADETLHSLAQGMAAALWYDLASIKELHVVERLQLKYLTDELSASEKGFVAKDSGPRLGKLVKAKHLIKASIDIPEAEKLSLQTALINTGSASYNPAYSTDDELSKAMKVQKQMTLAILDSLGIKVEGSQRRALKKTPTDSYSAFLAFSRGIEQFDQGQYGKAGSFFAEALRFDPSFDMAQDFRRESELLMTGSADLGKFETGILANIASESHTSSESNQEIFDMSNPTTDPRLQDLPTASTGTGSATVTGSIR